MGTTTSTGATFTTPATPASAPAQAQPVKVKANSVRKTTNSKIKPKASAALVYNAPKQLPKGYTAAPKGNGYGVARVAPRTGCSAITLAVLQVLASAKCTAPSTALGSTALAARGKFTPVKLRHHCYLAQTLGYAATAQAPTANGGYVYYLTAAGIAKLGGKARKAQTPKQAPAAAQPSA